MTLRPHPWVQTPLCAATSCEPSRRCSSVANRVLSSDDRTEIPHRTWVMSISGSRSFDTRRDPGSSYPCRLHRHEACPGAWDLSLIHISEPTRQAEISYAV